MKKIIILILSLFISGCAISEPFKTILGTSTNALENAKSQGISKSYNYKKDVCFDKTLVVLENMKACVILKNRQKSVIKAINFRDKTDTTELGIFFEKEDIDKTKITISSLSKVLLSEYSQKILDNLDKELEKK